MGHSEEIESNSTNTTLHPRSHYQREVLFVLSHLSCFFKDWKLLSRYPTFIDALQDLDDPLCLICTFINMPQKYGITSNRTSNCDRLYREWQAYVIQTHSLRKVFVSIKGVYFQAEVQGIKVTWIYPHQFVPEV